MTTAKRKTTRSLTKFDDAAFLKLYQDVFPQQNITAALVARIHDDEPAWVLVAENHDGLLGFIYAWFVTDEVQILDLGVADSVRRQGVAQALLKRLEKEARNIGALRMVLEVRTDNQAARNLYESEGFTYTGRRPKYYADGCDGELMEKSLQSV